MPHLTIADLEADMAKLSASPDQFVQDDDGAPFCRVETGKYKPYMLATVRAAERRGYRVVRRVEGVYAVYPKPAAAKSDAFDAVDFAKRSAAEAFDQRDAYTDPVGSYRDNVIDTLAEQKVTDAALRHAALDAFDDEVVRLFAPQPAVTVALAAPRKAPTIHTFDDTEEAYDACQWNDEIKAGDLLHIPTDGVVAIAGAWPTAVTVAKRGMHSVPLAAGWSSIADADTLAAARELARSNGYPLDEVEEAKPVAEPRRTVTYVRRFGRSGGWDVSVDCDTFEVECAVALPSATVEMLKVAARYKVHEFSLAGGESFEFTRYQTLPR